MHDYDLDEWGVSDHEPPASEKRVIPGFGGVAATTLEDKDEEEDDRPE